MEAGTWDAKAEGTTAGATATHAAKDGRRWVITWAEFFSDTTTVVELKRGTTSVRKIKIPANAPYLMSGFEMEAGNNEAVSAVLATSTAVCYVNFGGKAR
jgi:hypothetical protein